jgi:type IV pilus assembly protein PilA
MKSTFTAKYLQHLNKKNGNKGFTLIELLVVIIIVGVLAAIALPSFLSQIGKARGAEAKSNLGTIARAQQTYRAEQSTMASTLTELDAKISGKFYSYVVTSPLTNSAGATAVAAMTSMTDIKHYSAAVLQVAATAGTPEFFGQIICETKQNGGGTPPAPTTVPNAAGVRGACDSTMNIVD